MNHSETFLRAVLASDEAQANARIFQTEHDWYAWHRVHAALLLGGWKQAHQADIDEGGDPLKAWAWWVNFSPDEGEAFGLKQVDTDEQGRIRMKAWSVCICIRDDRYPATRDNPNDHWLSCPMVAGARTLALLDHDFSGSDGTAQTQTNVCKRCGFDAVKDPHRNCRVGSTV